MNDEAAGTARQLRYVNVQKCETIYSKAQSKLICAAGVNLNVSNTKVAGSVIPVMPLVTPPTSEDPTPSPTATPAPTPSAKPTPDERTTDKDTQIDGKIEVPKGAIPSIGKPLEHGKANIDPDGRWTYKPDQGYIGKDTITIVLKDPNGNETETFIDIEVQDIPLGTITAQAIPVQTLPKTGEASHLYVQVAGLCIDPCGNHAEKKNMEEEIKLKPARDIWRAFYLEMGKFNSLHDLSTCGVYLHFCPKIREG